MTAVCSSYPRILDIFFLLTVIKPTILDVLDLFVDVKTSFWALTETLDAVITMTTTKHQQQ